MKECEYHPPSLNETTIPSWADVFNNLFFGWIDMLVWLLKDGIPALFVFMIGGMA